MATSVQQWGQGDRVVHPGKPEWGVGHVTSAIGATQDGKPCQRLTVRFERAGVKTLSTAFAPLRAADERLEIDEVSDGLAGADAGRTAEIMSRIPESARDPFVPIERRLAAVLGLYRFNGRGGSLLDWAAMQSGLKDPLSRFSRHELERHFERFAVNLDAHLTRTMQDARRAGADVRSVAAAAPAGGVQALKRLNLHR